MYTTIRNQYETKKYAVYTILGYTMEGNKEIFGLWLNETESKHKWMQIFDEIKAREVEDIFFISMDGVSGLEEGSRAIFPGVIVQRSIVHLKGAFPNENALLKAFIFACEKTRNQTRRRPYPNWAMVINQLLLHENLKERALKYIE